MARTGYEGATVAAIAQEAGVASGVIHYHFESKGEILGALVDRVVAAGTRRVADRLEHAPDGRSRLLAVLDGLLDQSDDADPQAANLWAVIGAEAIRNPAVRQTYTEWSMAVRTELHQAFVAACREEGRSARHAVRSATTLLFLVEGAFRIGAGAPAVIPFGAAAPGARRAALALLDAQPGA